MRLTSASAFAFLAATATRSLAQDKLVFAHFIVGLTYSFTPADWKRHCQLAASHNFDAFALNVGNDPWQFNQTASAYDAADGVDLQNGNPFKLFLSLDMSAIGNNATTVTSWVTQFAGHPNALQVDNGRPLISTFSGEMMTLGASSLSDGWQAAVKAPLAALSPPVNPAFVPAWTGLAGSTAVSDNPVVDGIFPWSAWPMDNSNITTDFDQPFQTDAVKNKKLFMAAVSPMFFTHYASKNYILRSDYSLYPTRWQELLKMNPQPDFIQVVSWNDYGESHYLVSDSGTPPANTTWLDGFDHSAWLEQTDYWISYYKNGSAPKIALDQVFFDYRTSSSSAVASADALGPPTNASFSLDNVYATAFLSHSSSARQLRITGGNRPAQTFSVSPGVSSFAAPFGEGQVTVDLLDKKGNVLASQVGRLAISNAVSTFNFNYASEVLVSNGTSHSAAAAGPSVVDRKLPIVLAGLSSVLVYLV